MATYCLEAGSDGDMIIHHASCGNYDHASLLGQGKVYAIGEFASSCEALASVKRNFPVATRCLDCCKTDLLALPAIETSFLKPCETVPLWSLTDVKRQFAQVV